MSFNSLKQLLLRKIDNEELNKYIGLLGDSEFMKFVSESLEKMATSSTVDKANHPMNWTAKHLLPSHADMYRDALGHHVSHYSAALKNGDTKLADNHMRQVMKLLNFGTRLDRHKYLNHKNEHTEGNSKLKVDAVDDKAWQAQGRQQPRGTFGWMDAVNYDHLRKSPHGHKPYALDIEKHRKEGNDFTGAWPVERIKVNDKYIDVDNDLKSSGKYEPHVFDSHPIMDIYSKPQHNLSDEDHMNFIDKATKWHDPDNLEVNKWFDKQDSKTNKSSGTEPSESVHPKLADYVEGSNEEHDPSKHKLRLQHALDNPSQYHKPTDPGTSRNKKATKILQELGSNKAPIKTPNKPSLSTSDQNIVNTLKNIHKLGLNDDIIRNTLNRYDDNIIEAAGHKDLKEKLNAKN